MSYGMAEALESIEPEMGHTFTWNTRTLPCIYGDRMETKRLGYGGFATDADLTIVCRRELFTTLPQSQDPVTAGGRSLSIESVLHSADGELLILACNDPTKGV